jgi:hexokinase
MWYANPSNSDDSPTLDKAVAILHTMHPLPTKKIPSPSDLFFVRAITKLVTRRASAYLATGVHALWCLRINSEGLTPATAGLMGIGCNGSVIEKYPNFRPVAQSYLDDLTQRSGAPGQTVSLELAEESALFGAAVAVGSLISS